MFYCDTVSVCVRARNTVSVRVRGEIYDLLFTFAISAHGSKVQLTAYAQKPS